MGSDESLRILDPRLGALLRDATPRRQRRFAAECARWAVRRAGLDGDVVTRALSLCDQWESGEPPEMQALKGVRAELKEVRDQLDQQAFGPGPEVLAAGGVDARDRDPSPIFGQARAAGSLLAALGEDSLGAAAEAVYEAHALGRREAETLIELGRRILAP
ncbi:MAG TPA: hypothetical protein VH877_29230 [Polyangia bacterium]|jgi:hypothetical protein|nr:hypothetical protein [Polyangia bacterium]